MKEYSSSYYQRNRIACIARQLEYHKKNRDRYLEYMRSYNALYWLINKPEPKPKAPKKVKAPKPPKEKKPPKPTKEKKERLPKKEEWFVVREPVYPMKMERGNFVLEF